MVARALLPRLPRIVEQARAARGDSERVDDAKEINALIDQVSDTFFRGFSTAELEELAEAFARRTSEFQRRQLAKQVQAALGVELPFQDRGFRALVEAFTAENVALIKSIPQRFFEQVEHRVIADVREGLRWEEIAKRITERFEVAESSAKLVARDQVGKFFGEVQRARQKELGIATYIWRTSNDNRVRPEHEERDGRKFSWDDPPEDGHPGIPINCRCYAEPDLSGILASL